MKWILASSRLSGHLDRRCCRKVNNDKFWFTAHYDKSVKSYMHIVDASQRNKIPVEDIAWLDENDTSDLEDAFNAGKEVIGETSVDDDDTIEYFSKFETFQDYLNSLTN